MDEARRVIRRLERIEALQSARAPADELLSEVRQLLREGEAWIAAEHRHGDGQGRAAAGAGAADPTAGAAAVLEGCRATLGERREVVLETADRAAL
ncbi:MAG: hypothetical protein ACRDNG_06740 [Gaiellaceae bacterium]